MVGSWNVTVKSWMAPGQPPMESTGTAMNAWVLGGRWMEEKFTGSFMGMPFNGIGYTGYDNIRHTYTATWMDSMSTSMMTSSGDPDASGKNWRFAAMTMDPVSGESVIGPLHDPHPLVLTAQHVDRDREQLEILRSQRLDLVGTRKRLVGRRPRRPTVGLAASFEVVAGSGSGHVR